MLATSGRELRAIYFSVFATIISENFDEKEAAKPNKCQEETGHS